MTTSTPNRHTKDAFWSCSLLALMLTSTLMMRNDDTAALLFMLAKIVLAPVAVIAVLGFIVSLISAVALVFSAQARKNFNQSDDVATTIFGGAALCIFHGACLWIFSDVGVDEVLIFMAGFAGAVLLFSMTSSGVGILVDRCRGLFNSDFFTGRPFPNLEDPEEFREYSRALMAARDRTIAAEAAADAKAKAALDNTNTR